MIEPLGSILHHRKRAMGEFLEIWREMGSPLFLNDGNPKKDAYQLIEIVTILRQEAAALEVLAAEIKAYRKPK